MGVRETIGIALFAVALAITLSLTFNDDGFADGGEPRPISTGLTPPPLTAVPTATPTEVPSVHLGEPGASWLVSYFRHDANGDPQLETRIPETGLNLDFDHAPFPDMQDDNWSLEARTFFERPAGRYEFTLVTTGAVEVRVNGATVYTAGNLDRPQPATVVFDHLGGRMDVEVAAEDRGGPFVLAVLP